MSGLLCFRRSMSFSPIRSCWRCWVVYARSWKVFVYLGPCLIMDIVSTVSSMSHPVISAKWTLVYYVSTVITDTLGTFLIVYRILRVTGDFKTYRSLIEVLLESGFIYSASYTALLLVFAYEFFTLDAIAPTLVIARVMAGMSRPDDSWTQDSLPHLESDVLSPGASMQFARDSSDTRSGLSL
ncbi:hypothetical protein BDZ89DRAFT_826331 [Hymenopellis radicata]|nr:hypothetical protein BDZ89DRAFT_826331 [Hymenopellis radicata]